MSQIDYTKCATCGEPTPGNDINDLCDGFLNLCATHSADWWAQWQAEGEIFAQMYGPQE